MGSWLVRAHHSPGLPQNAEHFDPDNLGRRLRGRRRDGEDPDRHREQIARTNEKLKDYLKTHALYFADTNLDHHNAFHGLNMRLALSCLVDADHADSAFAETGQQHANRIAPRWDERLAALCSYVRSLPAGHSESERARNQRRSDFFTACLGSTIGDAMTACEGPVGLGKTTAVAAYLIRRAHEEGLRRLIIVAPYTNILRQTAERLRKALVLPGERATDVILEHHHRADFEAEANRELAVLWQAPIILTTAVSFFETLAANNPSVLRKLHALPGSAVFIDEAHTALPAKLWRQNWLWLRELAMQWSCRFVFASGSLARFWENAEIVANPVRLPELLPPTQAADVLDAERRRVQYSQASDGKVLQIKGLLELVRSSPGPRLVILNTVQNAAVVAKAMRDGNMNVLHLSTALTPRDRARILRRIEARLAENRKDWTLVATSCVEAGVDLSFRTAFRERFAVASTLQTGGRVNWHGEYDDQGGGGVYDFALGGDGITQHPAARVSADVLRAAMQKDALNQENPADVVTEAMRQELRRLPLKDHIRLCEAEAKCDYPAVAQLGRVIDADTRLVVVDARLIKRLTAHRPVSFRSLLQGSVQLWAQKIGQLGLQSLPGRPEVYTWNDAYDRDFLGIMLGVLRSQQFLHDPAAGII